MVMGVGDFVYAVFHGIAVYCATAEEGTGVTGIFVRRRGDGAGDIHINDFVGNVQFRHKAFGAFDIKERRASLSILELRIDGEGRQLKLLVQTFLENGHGISKENAVLAAGNAQQDMVAIMNHVEFHDGAHEFAVVELGDIEVHRVLLLVKQKKPAIRRFYICLLYDSSRYSCLLNPSLI